jgi:hypothetical protein
VATTAPWTCPTCHTIVGTRYCPACGETPPSSRHLTIRGFLKELVTSVTNIDGRLIRSLRALLATPGALTVAFVEGRRKPYLGPFQLFLLANVVFFAVQSITRGNVFSSPLQSHLHEQDWAELAQSLVADRIRRKGVTLAAYGPVFNHAVMLNAKSLIALMVLPFALVLPLVFGRQRRPFVAHAVFALHVYAFVLLLFCAGLTVASVERLLGGGGLQSERVDLTLTLLLLALLSVYLYLAIGRFYAARGVLRGVKALGLAFAMGGIGLGYRFLLFIITLYTTG